MTDVKAEAKKLRAIPDIHRKALLVRFSSGFWTGRKQDKAAASELNKSKKASADATRVAKYLLDAESSEPLSHPLNVARGFFLSQTLDWDRRGYRIIHIKNYPDFRDKMREFRQQCDAGLAELVAKWDELHDKARARLGDLWDESQWISASEFKRRFLFHVEVTNVPQSGHLIVDLESEMLAEIAADMDRAIESKVRVSMLDTWTRLYEHVTKVRDKLAQSDSIFRDSMIENLRETIDKLPTLQVGHDPELDAMIDKVNQALALKDPQALREDKPLRAEVAKTADQIAEEMQAYMGALQE